MACPTGVGYRHSSGPQRNETEPLSQLEALVSTLKLRGFEHEDDIRRPQSASSAIQQIPVEVLGETFQYLVIGYLDRKTSSIGVNLCLVCRHWNFAARLTHELWARVSIMESPTQRISFGKVDAWLRRAGDAPRPLKVRLKDKRVGPFGRKPIHSQSTRTPATAQVWADLPAQGPPPHHVSILCSNAFRLESFLRSLQLPEAQRSVCRPWDSIKSLSLMFDCQTGVVWNDSSDPESSIFWKIPASVTELKIGLPLTLCTDDLAESKDLKLHLPTHLLRGLASLRIHCDWQGTRILSVLQGCLNVEELTLNFIDAFAYVTEEGWPDGDPLIMEFVAYDLTLPRLRFLRLEGLSSTVTKISEFLKAPCLASLELAWNLVPAKFELPKRLT